MSTKKTRTITLTDRPPVKIVEEDWPRIAWASGDSWGTSGDYGRHQQALGQGELDEYHLVARQHADGRALVYAVLDAASAWTGSEDCRGGELLETTTSNEIAEAIRRVGECNGIPNGLIRECVADLPAEEL